MKKVFNVSLLAASVAMAFSANAVVIQTTADSPTLSNQGIEVGEVSAAPVTFDVTVQREHPAGSEIVLTFSDTVDLTDVDGGACDFTTTPSVGICGDVTFNVGNGNFTFDNVVVDEEEGTISYFVNLGNSLIANSAFRVTINEAEISGSATVQYTSNLAGDEIESSAATVIAETADQYALTVSSRFSNSIERTNRLEFVNGLEDEITLTYTDRETLLAASADAGDLTVVLEGDFRDANASDWVLNGVAAVTTTPTAVTFEIDAGALSLGANNTVALPLNFTTDGVGPDMLRATSFAVSAELEFTGPTTSETAEEELLDQANAGQWRLDASVVNVPYLPINYGFTPNVEIANQGATSADIIIEAIDNVTGEVLGPVTLVNRSSGEAVVVGGESLITVTEADIVRSLDLGDSRRKMSITFIIDADEGDITLAPYYRQGESRINVLTDQYKG